MRPPFSNQAALYPASVEMRVYIGNSQVWTHTRTRNDYAPAIMLPPGEDYLRFQWPVHGREVLVIQLGDFDERILQSFCEHLVITGATIVRVVYRNTCFSTFIPEVRNAA